MPGTGTAFAVETLDQAAGGATAYGREDLAARLSGARHLLSDPAVTIYVVGEFKQGKSSLINGLVGAPVCPVDDDIATAVPTRVRHAPETSAVAIYQPTAAGGTAWTEDVPLDEISSYVTESGNQGNSRRLRSLSVGFDSPLLSTGLTLVDTPGVGGVGSVHHAVTVSSLPEAHAVVFVSDASQELSAAEITFLHTVGQLCPTVLFVLTKCDLYPEWQRIRDIDQRHLAEAGVRADVFGVSSALRGAAIETQDHDLNAESGFSPVIAALEAIVGDAERVALAAVGSHVLSAVEQLRATVESRAVALTTPERSAALVAELARARERADALRERTAQWQQVLVDGFADISSDIDYDLRARSRAVLHEAERAIDGGDPRKDWPAFEQWLRGQLASEAMANYGEFTRRARELAERVAERFELAADDAVLPSTVLAPVEAIEEIEIELASSAPGASGRFASAVGIFQRSYGGGMMVNMLSGMAGLALGGPAGLGIGLAIMGGSGVLDERKRGVERRRSAAKAAVRRFVDEFTMQVGKDSRDSLRLAQREMRDGYTRRVEELHRSASEALTAAQNAAAGGEAEAGELGRLQADLTTLAGMRDRAREILAHSTPSRSVAGAGRP